MNSDQLTESIHEFKNRKRYSKLTQTDLNNISDKNIEQTLIDYIIDNVVRKDYKHEYELIKQLPIPFQYVWATWTLEGEVNNGGFNQYFYNSAGQFAIEAHEGYSAFGDPELANIVTGAINTLSKEERLHIETKRAGTMKAFMHSYKESKLGFWDKQFYDKSENIEKLRIKYIRNHISDFVTK